MAHMGVLDSGYNDGRGHPRIGLTAVLVVSFSGP